MLIALKEKCKENAKHLPSANERAKMALGNEADRGKRQLNKSRRRRVWNPQLVAVWNQTVGLYGINPKENAPAVMPYAFGDYILTCGEITCQSFGLDRKKTVRKRSFFLAPPVGLEPTTS